VVTADVARVYTDARYAEAAIEAAEGSPWAIKAPRTNIYIDLTAELAADGVDLLVMESSAPYGRFRFVSEQFRGRVIVTDQWVEQQREVKEAAEIERIAAAAELTDRAMAHGLSLIAEGRTERDIALEIEFFMRRNGAEDVAFTPIVASGPNSSRPHAQITDRAVESGDFVVIDIGARVDGYCADLTRTVVLGAAGPEQRDAYEAVLAANEAAIGAARAGVSGIDLDAVARDLLQERGYGAKFGHGLGHGVGLDVHELPHVSERGRDPMPAGAVVTIEPGVYVPGVGGVRIEDLVVIDDAGCQVLSHAPTALTEI
jgi:Xaa-Pro aminopeptidase